MDLNDNNYLNEKLICEENQKKEDLEQTYKQYTFSTKIKNLNSTNSSEKFTVKNTNETLNNKSVSLNIKYENNLDNLKIFEQDNENVSSKSKKLKKYLINILLGQAITIIGVINGYSVDKIQNNIKMNYPLILTSLYYIALFILYILIDRSIKKPKVSYLFIAFFDSQAAFLNIFAFSIISFNFPFIINISTFFWTVIITVIFIKTYKYSYFHYIGVTIAVIGIILSSLGIIFYEKDKPKRTLSMYYLGDVLEKKYSEIIGIILCVLASICYASSSIIQEIYIENFEVNEYLKWLGIFGTIIITIESFILGEIPLIFYEETTKFNIELLLYFMLFLATYLGMVSYIPYYINRCSASMLNVNMVFQIFWSYILVVIQTNEVVNFF